MKQDLILLAALVLAVEGKINAPETGFPTSSVNKGCWVWSDDDKGFVGAKEADSSATTGSEEATFEKSDDADFTYEAMITFKAEPAHGTGIYCDQYVVHDLKVTLVTADSTDSWSNSEAVFALSVDYYASPSCPANVSSGSAATVALDTAFKFTADNPDDTAVSACLGLLMLGADTV